MSECIHCGTRFSPSSEVEKFCCKGCEFVHGLIREEGLERFYDLRDKTAGQPVQDRPFQAAEFGWLEEKQRTGEEEAAQEGRSPTLQLHVRGISCVGCVWLIEKLFNRTAGALEADVFPSDGRLELSWQAGRCDLPAFAAELQRFGYGLEPHHDNGERRAELQTIGHRLGLCGAFALNGMVFTLPRYLGMDDDFAFAGIFDVITLISATFALLIGGSFFIVRAWGALRRGVLHIDLPIALGIVAAYAGSIAGWSLDAERLLYFDFVAIFTFLMLGGRYLHLAAADRVRRNLHGQRPLPDTVTLADGTRLTLDELAPGDTYRVESGEVVPVSSLLRVPSADFSLAWMTGEPAPVTIHAGRRVAAGAVNLGRASILVRAEEPLSASLVAALARQSGQPARSRTLERILRIYLGAVLLIAIAGGLAWAVLARDFVLALQVTLSVLVVSCPCALGVAIPLVDQRAAAALQRLGVFIQNPTLWHRLKLVRHLLLDKTGTLTLERPQLCNEDALTGLRSAERAALLSLVAASLHPLARSLLEALGGTHSDAPGPAIEELPGLGVRFQDHESSWSLGRPDWDGLADRADGDRIDGDLACDLRRDGHLVARFAFREEARPEAAEALAVLADSHRIGAHIFSGDRDARVKEQARRLGLDPAHAHGDLDPHDKGELVAALSRDDTLYLGDGANDSLAFDAAAATGTPAADRSVLERKADFFFTARGLGFLPLLFATARWRHRTARQILLFAIGYNLAAVAICLAGAMSPLLAAILMPLSSLACLALAARRLPRPAADSTPRRPTPSRHDPISPAPSALRSLRTS